MRVRVSFPLSCTSLQIFLGHAVTYSQIIRNQGSVHGIGSRRTCKHNENSSHRQTCTVLWLDDHGKVLHYMVLDNNRCKRNVRKCWWNCKIDTSIDCMFRSILHTSHRRTRRGSRDQDSVNDTNHRWLVGSLNSVYGVLSTGQCIPRNNIGYFPPDSRYTIRQRIGVLLLNDEYDCVLCGIGYRGLCPSCSRRKRRLGIARKILQVFLRICHSKPSCPFSKR